MHRANGLLVTTSSTPIRASDCGTLASTAPFPDQPGMAALHGVHFRRPSIRMIVMRRVLTLVSLLLLALALTACGQKGDLVLPTQPAASSATVVAPAATAAQPAATPVTPPSSSSGG